VIILNTGGTFNKRYDPVKGRLIVPKDDEAVEDFLKKSHWQARVEGLIYKDSLEFEEQDRQELLEAAKKATTPVVIVHGTDTMDLSAAFLAKHLEKKVVVFTGAMVPYSIDPTEASANLSLALGAAGYMEDGVWIAIHGLVARYDRIYKDRKKGVFCLR